MPVTIDLLRCHQLIPRKIFFVSTRKIIACSKLQVKRYLIYNVINDKKDKREKDMLTEETEKNFAIAETIVYPTKKKEKELYKKILTNWAPVVSAFSCLMLVLLYLHWQTVFNYYCVSLQQLNGISLTMLFPLAVFLIGCSTILYQYIGQCKLDKAIGNVKISWLKIMYLGFFFQMVSTWLEINKSLFGMMSGFLIAFAIEVVGFLIKKSRIYIQKSIAKHDFSVNEAVENIVLFGNTTVLFVLSILMIINVLVPIITRRYLDQKHIYQCFTYEDTDYVVAIELNDYVIGERIEVDDQNLTINAQSYLILKKENRIYEIKNFDEVTIIR